MAAFLAGPLATQAQVREVVSKQVSVGRSSTSLALEFADGGRLDIVFEDGSVLIDDREIGAFEPGAELDTAWRGLLGQAVTLDDGPLAAALAAWTPPAQLSGGAATVAGALDRSLDEALRAREATADARPTTISRGDPTSLIRALIGSPGRLARLEEAFDGLGSDLTVYADEDASVVEGQVLRGDLIVIGGDARIAGRVDGDLVAIGGTVELVGDGEVTGDVRLVDAVLLGDDDAVGGSVTNVSAVEGAIESELRAELRDEIRRSLRDERGGSDEGRGFSLFAPFRAILGGVGGVLQDLVFVFILALVGAGVLAFAGDKFDVIAETARRAPGRAAAVGLAGTVLLIPIWIVGFVALVVSIVGIPVALAWLPLFPLAACAAAIVGYLAVARNTGEWLADTQYPWTQWIRKSNPLMAMVGGLLGLALFSIASNVVSMAPFLGFVEGVLFVGACVVTIGAAEIGLGAVILTRAGRRREHWPYDRDAAWEAAMDIDLDLDEPVAQASATKGTEEHPHA